VADIIEAGIIPAGLEMMDSFAIEAAEGFANVGYPLDQYPANLLSHSSVLKALSLYLDDLD
jgi:glycolate oxidase